VIRVLVVDDHQVVRQGLRFVLEQEEGIEVVGECADGPSALQAVRTLEPAVVLLDLFLPGQDGISVLGQIKQDRPATEVLVLTSSSDEEHLLAAVRAGAIAYLPKTAGVDQVVASVRAAARGESVLEPRIAARLVREVRDVAARRRPLDHLSPREREVLHPGQAAARRPDPGGDLRPAATARPPRPGAGAVAVRQASPSVAASGSGSQ
jgi:NarL family two-component system response regulator LiaR